MDENEGKKMEKAEDKLTMSILECFCVSACLYVCLFGVVLLVG